MVAVLFVLFVCAPSAHALGVAVPSSTSVGTLRLGQTATSPPAVISVTAGALETWSLRVDDASAGSPTPGRMRSGGGPACSGATDALASRVHLSSSAGLPTTTVDRPELDLASVANAQIAHGSVGDVLNVVFSQPVGSAEQLRVGCTYSVSIQWTIVSG
jgi:hypothetical protein